MAGFEFLAGPHWTGTGYLPLGVARLMGSQLRDPIQYSRDERPGYCGRLGTREEYLAGILCCQFSNDFLLFFSCHFTVTRVSCSASTR